LNLILWLGGVLLLTRHAATETAPYAYWRESLLNTLVFSAVGVLVATRRSGNPIGWLFVAIGLTSALQFLTGEYAATALDLGPERLPGGPMTAGLSILVQTTLAFSLLFVLLLFPTGRLVSLRWRIVAWMGVGSMSLSLLANALRPGPLQDFAAFDNPFGVDAAILGTIDAVAGPLSLATVIGAVLSLIVRLRRARGEERQQLKWFVAAAVLAAIVLFGVSLLFPEEMSGELGNFLWAILIANLPVAVGITILRYRLYDIDLIINRTLVYGVLTATLALLYVGGVVSLQGLFRALTGEDSQLAVVASTLAIAALFNPLRRRIQAFIDRRFYRKKYDAQKTLAAFSARLRDEVELDALSQDLVAVVRETMQPAHVFLWLKPADGGEPDRAQGAE
jgi:hypothetical protein